MPQPLATWPWQRVLAWVLWGAALAFVVSGYDQHTPSNDEWVQHVYGELLWDFYLSGGQDRTFLGFSNLFLYGGLFDLIAAGLSRALGWEWWPWRHVLTAMFGLAALLATARLARFIAGRQAEGWAMLLLLLTGPFWGAIFTHTKDVPFAAAMAWGLYYTARLVVSFPQWRWRHALLWGVAVGSALGLRVAGLLLVAFLAVGLLARLAISSSVRRAGVVTWPRLLVRLMTAGALALTVMALSWPWSVMGWDHVWLALTKFSHFSFDIYTWEDGERLKNAEVSRWYLHHYLLVRLPEAVWIGMVAWLAHAVVWVREVLHHRHTSAPPRHGPRVHWPHSWQRGALVAFAVGFVLLYVALKRPPLYNGIRHFLFLVPWLVVLAAWGYQALLHTAWHAWQPFRRHRVRGWIATVVAATGGGFALIAAGTQAALHPYEHVYYNLLAGGLKRADMAWETDYWSDATRALIPALQRWLEGQPPGSAFRLAYCAEGFQIERWLPEAVSLTRDWRDADLFLSTTHDDCHLAIPGQEIARIERRGVPLAVLKDVRGAFPVSPEAPAPAP